MSLLAQRLQAIKPSPTFAIGAKAQALRAAGKKILNLSMGEPDFPTHETIVEAAHNAAQRGETRYTAVEGTPSLKKAIVHKFKRDNQLDYEMNEIIVGTGAKQVIFNALFASLNPGDEVIIPAPYWVSYPDMVTLASGTPVFARTTAEDNFLLKPETLAALIKPQTKWLIINAPSNPTGNIYPEAALKALAEVLLQHPHVHILSDDIYEYMRYDGVPFFTMAQVEPRLKGRTVTVNGVSKSYAMTGWRLGYGAGPASLIQAMTVIQSQMTSNPSSISQAAAEAAILGPQEYIKERNDAYAKRRDFLVERLNKIPNISCLKPEGAFYVFPSCKGLLGANCPDGSIIRSSNDFAAYLLEAAEVAIVPGIAFGMEHFFRISYAAAQEVLEEACNRIEAAVAKLT